MACGSSWAFGGVLNSALLWLALGGLAGIGCWWINVAWYGLEKTRVPGIVYVLLLGLGLVFIQLSPLPQSLFASLAPKQAELRQEVIAPAEMATESPLLEQINQDTRITLDSFATKKELRLLVLAITCFFLAIQFVQQRLHFLWMCVAIVVNGLAFGVFGVVQKLAAQGDVVGKIYWTFELTSGGNPFAAFVNRNNAGAYLLMCFGCALALTIWTFTQKAKDAKVKDSAYMELSGTWDKFTFLIRRFVSELDFPRLASLIVTVALCVSIVLTGSRGSLVALIAGSIGSSLVVVFASKKQVLFPLAVVFALSILGGFLAYYTEVGQRLETVDTAGEVSEELRLALWNDMIPAMIDYSLVGSGLGTFKHLHHQYVTFDTRFLYSHAENQYIQTIVEVGAFGLVLLLVALGWMMRYAHRILNRSSSPKNLAIGYGGFFVLIAIAVHSFFDFALYIPANTILFSLICGGIVGVTVSQKKKKKRKPGSSKRRSAHSDEDSDANLFVPSSGWAVHGISICIALVLFGTGVVSVLQIYRGMKLQHALRTSRYVDSFDGYSLSNVEQSINEFETLSGYATTDSTFRLGQLWTLRYRRQLFESMLREASLGESNFGPAWNQTSLAMFHSKLIQMKNEAPELTGPFLESEIIKSNLQNAKNEFERSLYYCPIRPMVMLRFAELSPTTNSREVDLHLVKVASKLNPNNVKHQYLCGYLALNHGDKELASECWKKSLSSDGKYVASILALSRGRLTATEFVEEILPPNHELILELLDGLGPADSILHTKLVDKLETVVERVELDRGFKERYLARVNLERGLYDQAAGNFRAALVLRPLKVEWRFEYADVLKKLGQTEEALAELRRCADDAYSEQKYEKAVKQYEKELLNSTKGS